MKKNQPEDFKKAVNLERDIRKQPKYSDCTLFRGGRLDSVDFNSHTPPVQPSLFGQVEHCDSGACWV